MQKVLIASSDDFILYQPTILNLYDFLQIDFEVVVLTFEPEYLGKKKDLNRNIIYLECPAFAKKLFRFIDLSINFFFKRIDKYLFKLNFRVELLRGLKCRLIAEEIKRQLTDYVIAVDLMPLYAALSVSQNVHFLSLELQPYDSYLQKIDFKKIKSVITQNEDRFNYLFKNLHIHKFFIQNAPLYKNKNINKKPRNGLIWAGSIIERFGVFDCINFIEKYPEYKLMLKGASEENTRDQLYSKYLNLINENKIVVDESYLEVNDYIKYISNFKIGLCFYSWDLINANFNYRTAPSGKLFMYLAAGVPVIACNIQGFKFIEEHKAGVLIDNYESVTIYNAVKKIELNYDEYQNNCYKLFDEVNFDVGAKSFKNYLLSGQK